MQGKERRRHEGQRRRCDDGSRVRVSEISEDDTLLTVKVKVEVGATAKEFRWPLKAGRGKEMDPLLDLPEECNIQEC